MTPEFLSVSDVLRLHTLSIQRFGGADGVRDLALVESAVAQPQASFDGLWLHHDLTHMASAYLYSLVSNHPFVDGNKRTGVFAALQFLELNGHPLGSTHTRALTRLTLGVAQGQLTKQDVHHALDTMTHHSSSEAHN